MLTIEASKTARPLHVIARDIYQAWPKVNYAAKPYLDAMQDLSSINDKYGYDDARSIVLYFLSNAASFRGDSAKTLKLELKSIVGIK
jgi:hypothetical protein